METSPYQGLKPQIVEMLGTPAAQLCNIVLINRKFLRHFSFAFFCLVLLACGGSDAPKQDTQPVPVEPMISEFSFLTQHNPSLSNNLNLSISGNTITGRFPADADWHSMIATFRHNGASLIVKDSAQTSAVSVQDFSGVQTYTVIMEDGRQDSYTVDVTAYTGLPIIYLTTIGEAPIYPIHLKMRGSAGV